MDQQDAPVGEFLATCTGVLCEKDVTRPKFQGAGDTETTDTVVFTFTFTDQECQEWRVSTEPMTLSGHPRAKLFRFLSEWAGEIPPYGWNFSDLQGHSANITLDKRGFKTTVLDAKPAGGNPLTYPPIGENPLAVFLPFSRKICDRVRSGPKPGETHHTWLVSIANILRGVTQNKDTLFAYLRDEVDRMGHSRPIPDHEIQSAINKAFDETKGVVKKDIDSIPWPEINPEAQLAAIKDFDPIPATPGLTTALVLPWLFSPEDLLCIGANQLDGKVLPLKDVKDIGDKFQFIVANPMIDKLGVTKDGKLGPRCQSNVKYRKYLVVEFDDTRLGQENQLRLLRCLANIRPLVMVVHSGGKSLHGWFEADSNEGVNLKFYGCAVLLGADKTIWNIGGWVRMPGGTRMKGDGSTCSQPILYFDEKKVPK